MPNYTRIVLVVKRTPYEELLLEYGTHGNAAFLLQSRGENVDDYRKMYETYQEVRRHVEASLPRDVAHTLVERRELPHFLFRPDDLVVAVGPDGLFANLAKYLNDQPVIAINPLPESVDGVVMRFSPKDVKPIILKTLSGDTTFETVTLAEATTSEGERLLAVNDFLVGRLDHISARYRIEQGVLSERQSSSGVLVSTGIGASGWLRSLKRAVDLGKEGNELLIPRDPDWGEQRLVFAVREPFPSRATKAWMVYGSIDNDSPLIIQSEMPEGGVVFSDGVPEDSLALPAGTSLTIKVAPERAILVRP